MPHPSGIDFLVNKSEWKQHRFDEVPAHGQKRSAEWGAGEFDRRLGASWSGFPSFSERWLEGKRRAGKEDVATVYGDTLAGRTEPRHGRVLTLWDES